MTPQIQRARAALRAIHRMDALMRASQEARADVEAPQASNTMDDAQADLDTPLLESVTPEEAVANDARTSRPSSASQCLILPINQHTSQLFKSKALLDPPFVSYDILQHRSFSFAISAASAARRPSFKAAVQDIQEARQHLNRVGSTSLANLSEEEQRARVLGMFSSIRNSAAWRTGTGTGLMKEQITDEHQESPGADAWNPAVPP